MFRLYTAASGMSAQQLNLDNVANNWPMPARAGFRRRRLQFSDMIYQNMIMPGICRYSTNYRSCRPSIGLGTRPEPLRWCRYRVISPIRESARSDIQARAFFK